MAGPSPRKVYDYLRPIAALALLFAFLIGVESLATGIKGLGKGTIDAFLTTVTNPGIGLVAGILATTLAQSSSVTTSLLVGMVGSGVLPLALAVPMIMGANIGTTVTNTIAALAQIGKRTEFRRAFAAATCHDFFNYLTVLVLFPLEVATGFLFKLSTWVDGLLPSRGLEYESPFKNVLKVCVKVVESLVPVENPTLKSVLLMVLSVGIIFTSLFFIVRVMKGLVLRRMEGFLNKLLSRSFTGGAIAILAGIIFTVLVQSSSVTTSVLVPLAGAGLLRLWQVYPITVGANIGTTVTALLASLAVSGEHADVARQLAVVHLLFNLVGTLLFYLPPWTRAWPLALANRLSVVAVRSRRWALFYVALAFYGVPAIIVFLGG